MSVKSLLLRWIFFYMFFQVKLCYIYSHDFYTWRLALALVGPGCACWMISCKSINNSIYSFTQQLSWRSRQARRPRVPINIRAWWFKPPVGRNWPWHSFVTENFRYQGKQSLWRDSVDGLLIMLFIGYFFTVILTLFQKRYLGYYIL